jgi:hypothetical protein
VDDYVDIPSPLDTREAQSLNRRSGSSIANRESASWTVEAKADGEHERERDRPEVRGDAP